MVSVIIPAYNEEMTVGKVIRSIAGHKAVREIIVVDDGSTDSTSVVAKQNGARVITLRTNQGKANAMDVGVQQALCNIIFFTDADINGLTHEKISRIINPVVSGDYEMYVCIRTRKIILLNKFLHLFPIISGERALTKGLWNMLSSESKRGFKIEIALNHMSKQTEKGMGFELIEGITQTIKEKKYGFRRGLSRRLKMIYEILEISFILYVIKPTRTKNKVAALRFPKELL